MTAARRKTPRERTRFQALPAKRVLRACGSAKGWLDYFRCAYASLAVSYARAIEELERSTGRRYQRLYIVGGGAKNAFLNELTERATGKRVIALPIEATALGNIKIQNGGQIK